MADDKPSYIAADVYTISRQMQRGMNRGNIPLVFKGSDGNPVLTANKGMTGRHAIMVDVMGRQVGSIGKSGITFMGKSKYEFFDDKNTKMGEVEIKSSLMGLSETIKLSDQNGKPMGTATGNFAGQNYVINGPDGSTIAKISRSAKQQNPMDEGGQTGGLMGMIGQMGANMLAGAMAAYTVEITDKSIDERQRLAILELVFILDDMFQPRNPMGGGGGMQFGVGMPGGGSIKF